MVPLAHSCRQILVGMKREDNGNQLFAAQKLELAVLRALEFTSDTYIHEILKCKISEWNHIQWYSDSQIPSIDVDILKKIHKNTFWVILFVESNLYLQKAIGKLVQWFHVVIPCRLKNVVDNEANGKFCEKCVDKDKEIERLKAENKVLIQKLKNISHIIKN